MKQHSYVAYAQAPIPSHPPALGKSHDKAVRRKKEISNLQMENMSQDVDALTLQSYSHKEKSLSVLCPTHCTLSELIPYLTQVCVEKARIFTLGKVLSRFLSLPIPFSLHQLKEEGLGEGFGISYLQQFPQGTIWPSSGFENTLVMSIFMQVDLKLPDAIILCSQCGQTDTLIAQLC
ncbi:hypothetical protein DY000_02014241 [Brassica cretica]|uniref:Uncharacterized protein n=1 Tax=Brassica cretica TaxID=69181 RepID=A0ABQ7DAF2_BRACR|nr:hypothetical protein DY000_02014241 [Brassica cretica]